MNALAIVAGIIGAFLLAAGWKPHRPAMITAGGLWLVYAVYEALVANGILCDANCNIRVDLVLLIPILLVVTAYAGWVNRRSLRQPSDPN